MADERCSETKISRRISRMISCVENLKTIVGVDRPFCQKERSNFSVYLHMIKFPAEMNPGTGAEISTQLRSSPFLSFTNWKFGTSVT